MPAVVRSTIGDIVTVLLALLAKYTGIPATRIKLWRSGAQLPPAMDGDNDLVVQVSAPTPDTDSVTGAGRVDTRLTRTVTVSVRTRCELDEASADPVRLLDLNIGHYALEEKVIDALQVAFVSLAADDLLVQPARMSTGAGAAPAPVFHSSNWTVSALPFEIVYESKLTQDRY